MNKKTIILAFTAIFSLSLFFSSCVDQKFENPTTCSEVDLTATHTIQDLLVLYQGETFEITEDIIIEGTVTSSDEFGNFYKELVIEDETGALSISIDASYLYTKYPLGQKVFVKCKGLYLGEYGEVVKLGSIYEEYGYLNFGRIQGSAVIDAHFINSCENNPIEPKTISLSEVGLLNLYKLVKIENVQFNASELGSTWADVENLETINHNIIDVDGRSLIVRTSGYSKFARDTLPDGNGSIIGILSKYNSDYQLFIRSIDDVSMEGNRFADPIYKDFEDADVLSGGWTNYVVEGVSWDVSSNYAEYGEYYGICTSYGESTTESWLISPELDLAAFASPFVTFENACNYNGPAIEVKYSADYDGISDPNTATWTDLSPTLSGGSWDWVNSGNLTLPSNAKYVAFVYTGTSSSAKTWEIDNILIDDAGK